MAEVEIGRVTHFFSRPVVAGIQLSGDLKDGDKIRIKGHTTNIEMVVISMQINNVNVSEGKRGDEVGVRVPDKVRQGDIVYKVTD